MYQLLGGDGKQYGPVSLDQLRQWRAEGRATDQSLVRAATDSVWRTLAEVVASPPHSTNSQAIAGLVLGIVSVTGGLCCCGPLFSIAGIICSAVALAQINRAPLAQTGKGLALTGLLLSIGGLVLQVALGLAFLFIGLASEVANR